MNSSSRPFTLRTSSKKQIMVLIFGVFFIAACSTSSTATTEVVATPKSITCVDKSSIFNCQAIWSNGISKAIEFPNMGSSHSGEAYVAKTVAVDDLGDCYSVFLYADGQGSFARTDC